MQESLWLLGGAHDKMRDTLVATYRAGKERDRSMYVVSGLCGQANYVSFRDCVENARTALLERVFFHEVAGVYKAPVDPGLPAVRKVMARFESALKCFAVPVKRVPHGTYHEAYSGRRRALYQRAEATLARRGPRYTDCYSSTFLKFEKMLEQWSMGVEKWLVPRLIQPAKPEYNVLIGRFLKPLEHVMYHALERVFGAPVVMKGRNAYQTGELFAEAWARYRDPVALRLDAKRFDQHQKLGILGWTHIVYQFFCALSNEEREYLKWRLTVHGFMHCCDGDLKYVVHGCKCSGHIDTALGNVLVMCGAIYSFLHHYGLARPGWCAVSVFDNGDDCTLVGERSIITMLAPLVDPFFQQLGLIMKVEPIVDVLEKATFCQTVPVFDGVAWRMVRDPHLSMSKDATILGKHFTGDLLGPQLHAISQCGLALTAGLPVLQSYYLAMGRGQSKVRGADIRLLDTGFFRLAHGLQLGRTAPVTDAARVSFARAFDICPDLQVELERQFDASRGTVGGAIGEGCPDRIVLA